MVDIKFVAGETYYDQNGRPVQYLKPVVVVNQVWHIAYPIVDGGLDNPQIYNDLYLAPDEELAILDSLIEKRRLELRALEASVEGHVSTCNVLNLAARLLLKMETWIIDTSEIKLFSGDSLHNARVWLAVSEKDAEWRLDVYEIKSQLQIYSTKADAIQGLQGYINNNYANWGSYKLSRADRAIQKHGLDRPDGLTRALFKSRAANISDSVGRHAAWLRREQGKLAALEEEYGMTLEEVSE